MKKFVAFVLLSFSICFSVFATDKVILSRASEDAFLWSLSGTDKNGNPSVVYILGTFHLGDERLYPLPETVLSAFDNADIICGEISTEGWAEQMSLVTQEVSCSALSDPDLWLNNVLTEEELNIINEYLDEKTTQVLFGYKPAVLNSYLSSFVYLSYDFDFTTAYDLYLINRAKEQNRHMDGLDLMKTQIDCLFYGDYDFQLEVLKSTLEQLDNPSEAEKLFKKVYEAYLSNDEKQLTEAYSEEIKIEIEKDPGLKDYYQTLFFDRNNDWVPKILNYLDEGGSTFIFAGCGHFIGEGSVFDLMKQQGFIAE